MFIISRLCLFIFLSLLWFDRFAFLTAKDWRYFPLLSSSGDLSNLLRWNQTFFNLHFWTINTNHFNFQASSPTNDADLILLFSSPISNLQNKRSLAKPCCRTDLNKQNWSPLLKQEYNNVFPQHRDEQGRDGSVSGVAVERWKSPSHVHLDRRFRPEYAMQDQNAGLCSDWPCGGEFREKLVSTYLEPDGSWLEGIRGLICSGFKKDKRKKKSFPTGLISIYLYILHSCRFGTSTVLPPVKLRAATLTLICILLPSSTIPSEGATINSCSAKLMITRKFTCLKQHCKPICNVTIECRLPAGFRWGTQTPGNIFQ